ncbi:hypothetical protein [Streptomyces sp. NPDC048349]|uniref:hypothetical protein n=1 Tax=Streptomyces sp. NPDC048349 TaxID=3155486 RepID=UPI00341BF141
MQINPYRIPTTPHRVDAQPLNIRPHQIPEPFVPHEHHAEEGTLPGMTDVSN